MTKNILIFPDIHGREFWKKETGNVEKYDKIIFLGDYCDSYVLDNKTIFENLVEIIEFKKQYPEKVILIWGNHDLQYVFLNYNEMKINFQKDYAKKYNKLFLENYHLFDLVYQIDIKGIKGFELIKQDKKQIIKKTFEDSNLNYLLFSHSGINYLWLVLFNYYIKNQPRLILDNFFNSPEFNEKIAETLNSNFKKTIENQNYDLITLFCYKSKSYSGPLFSEKEILEHLIPSTIQIVGHLHVNEYEVYKVNSKNAYLIMTDVNESSKYPDKNSYCQVILEI